jgi:hypothetical protein
MKRLLILLLALVTMTALPGQPGMLLVGDAAAPPPAQLLLDEYPGAAAAYSLRLLRAGYTGPCIEVRRNSDGQTTNIFFAGDVLDTLSLKSFCGSFDCTVRSWYDQSTSEFNAQQLSNTRQPLIVSSGVIIRTNGFPAIRFNGTSTSLRTSNATTYSGIISTFSIHNYSAIGSSFPYSYDQGTARYILYIDNPSAIRIYMSQDLIGPSPSLNVRYLSYALFNLTSSVFKINSLVYTGSTGTNFQTAAQIAIGSPNTLNPCCFLNGNFQELIIYRSDQSANEVNIRANMNAFHLVY